MQSVPPRHHQGPPGIDEYSLGPQAAGEGETGAGKQQKPHAEEAPGIYSAPPLGGTHGRPAILRGKSLS